MEQEIRTKWYNRLSPRACFLITFGLIILAAATLYLMGQVPWCKCGVVRLWHGVVFSSENSQHLSDWYTFTHIIHGFAFYLLLKLLFPRLPVSSRFLLAVLLESGWEILEHFVFDYGADPEFAPAVRAIRGALSKRNGKAKAAEVVGG